MLTAERKNQILLKQRIAKVLRVEKTPDALFALYKDFQPSEENAQTFLKTFAGAAYYVARELHVRAVNDLDQEKADLYQLIKDEIRQMGHAPRYEAAL